jgi:hypothetical protein
MAPQDVAILNAVSASRRTTPEYFPADVFRPVPINFWLDTLVHLGLQRPEIPTDFADREYKNRPTISQFFARLVPNPDVRLVLGERQVEGKDNETHVFPISGDHFVDGYTEGKVVRIGSVVVPADFDEFRIKRVFRVFE